MTMTDNEIYTCDHCGDRFFGFTINPHDKWEFQGITELEGVDMICRGCIYEILYKYYREKVWDIKDCIDRTNAWI